jgi:hypothetical protein
MFEDALMSKDLLDTEIEETQKAIESANQAIAEKEKEVVSLSGKLNGLLFARKLIPWDAVRPRKIIPEKKAEKIETNLKSVTGNPPVAEMVMVVLHESTKRLPYSEVCQKVMAMASNPVSPKTVSSTLATLKKHGKVNHTEEGYLASKAA